MFSKLIPTYGIRNISLYYIVAILTNGWFVKATWVVYWGKYMSFKGIGLFDALAFGVGLVAQIPSAGEGILEYLFLSLGIILALTLLFHLKQPTHSEKF